jgi:cation transport ATPase
MDDDKELLMRRAVFGEQVGQFLSSEIGAYLLERAKDEAERSVDKLKKCDPSRADLVRSLQVEVWRAESIEQWLREAVADGLRALEILEDRE